jgi:hypothetical protein
MWKVDVGLEEITGSVETMSGVAIKWCRENLGVTSVVAENVA